MKLRRADLSRGETPSRLERAADAVMCRAHGHVPKPGERGWENFGTGIYCERCSAMLNPDGSRFKGEARMRKGPQT
jgi:hypothetical protein